MKSVFKSGYFKQKTPKHDPESKIQSYKTLLDNKADINQTDEKGRSFLHQYLENGYEVHLKVIQFLLENKININATDENNATPLLLACGTTADEIIKTLLKNGADPNIITHNGKIPLLKYLSDSFHLNYKTVQLFFTKNQDPSLIGNKTTLFEECIKLGWLNKNILQQVFKQNPQLINHDTFCLYLKQEGAFDFEVVEFFLNNGANPNVLSNGSAAIHHAVRCSSQKFLQLFLNAGADLNTQDHKGCTPLYKACYINKPNFKFIQFLLENGADPHIEFSPEKNIIHYLYGNVNHSYDSDSKFKTLVLFFMLKGVPTQNITFEERSEYWLGCKILNILLKENITSGMLIEKFKILGYIPSHNEEYDYFKMRQSIETATFCFNVIEKKLQKKIPKYIKWHIFKNLHEKNELGFALFLANAKKHALELFISHVKSDSKALLELKPKENSFYRPSYRNLLIL